MNELPIYHGPCPYCGSAISVVIQDGTTVARCSHRGCGARGPIMRSTERAVELFRAGRFASQAQAAQSVLDATARAEAAERELARVTAERDEAKVELVQRGMEIDALVSEKRDAVEAFRDATRLRSQIQAARIKAEDERDAWHRQYIMMSEAQASALSGESEAVRRAEAAELGCEIAYRREPTQAEGDAHADGEDECFVPMGGWTGRRCRGCHRWAWGGPTACEACAAFEAGQERAEAAEKRAEEAEKQARLGWERAAEKDRAYGDMIRDRDHWRTVAESRPDISPEDAARYIAWRSGFAPHPRNFDRLQPIDDAMREHARKAAP